MNDDLTRTREASLRALRGESDVRAILPAFRDRSIASVLALAPIDPLVRSVAAIASGVPSLQAGIDLAAPALSEALRWCIGNDDGGDVLRAWAKVAPPRWGARDAHALDNALHRRQCAPWVVAALVGPEETTAAHLRDPRSVAQAIRCWGCAVPDDPTWWTTDLSPQTLDRLIAVVQTSTYWFSLCWPWLPDAAVDVASIAGAPALRALAQASDAVRTRRADAVRRLFSLDPPAHRNEWIDALIALAVASQMPESWDILVDIIRHDPAYAGTVLERAPWNELPADIQSVIRAHADDDAQCATIVYACGERDTAPPIARWTAPSFFAAVTRPVWDRMPWDQRRAWLDHLSPAAADVAVRALGNHPRLLACTVFGDGLIAAVRRHAASDEEVRSILFPVALRSVAIGDAYAMLESASPIDDDGAFAIIARGSVAPSLDPPAALPLRGRRDIAAHVALWRMARMHGDVVERCAILESIFTGRSWDDADVMLSTLGDEERRRLFSVRCDAVARVLSTLPPGSALPALHAVAAADMTDDESAGHAFSFALRNDGRTFLAAIDAMDAPQRAILAPLPRARRIGAAIRALAAVHPHAAWQIAVALNRANHDALVIGLAAAPPDHRIAVWHALARREKACMLRDVEALVTHIAAPGVASDDRSAIARACGDDVDVFVLIRLLARADATTCVHAITLLGQRPSLIRRIVPILRPDLRRMLEPHVLVHVADLTLHPHAGAMDERRQRPRLRSRG